MRTPAARGAVAAGPRLACRFEHREHRLLCGFSGIAPLLDEVVEQHTPQREHEQAGRPGWEAEILQKLGCDCDAALGPGPRDRPQVRVAAGLQVQLPQGELAGAHRRIGGTKHAHEQVGGSGRVMSFAESGEGASPNPQLALDESRECVGHKVVA